MNEQLAQALGIKFAVNRKGRSSSGSCDVRVTKTKSATGRYCISFSENAAKKIGEYARLAYSKKRLYIVPGCKDAYGFKLVGNNNSKRRYVYITQSTIGFIDAFIGDHTLQYYDDLDAYYVTAEGVEQ